MTDNVTQCDTRGYGGEGEGGALIIYVCGWGGNFSADLGEGGCIISVQTWGRGAKFWREVMKGRAQMWERVGQKIHGREGCQ